MSKTVAQIFALNPTTVIANTDLYYLVQSPYTPGTDAAISGASLKALFLQPTNNLSDLTNTTIARANLGLTAAATMALPVSAINGGTGVNNGASTITLGGSFSMVGAFTFAGTLTGNTTVTFPTSGTLATTAQLPTFPITLSQGGTNANLTANNGGIFYSTATAGAILAGTATARQMLQSGASAAPTWSTATWPVTTTANALLFSSAINTVSEIASAASATLITSAGSVPSFSQTLPSAVQTNITALGAQSQALNMNTHQINNLTAGVAATDAVNVGQLTAASSPLTTKGDLYTFTTVNARLPVAVGDGKVLQVSSGAATGLAYSTPTYPSASGSSGLILRSDGTNNVYTQSTFADLYAASSILYANGANNVAGLATANNGLLVTSATGVPSILSGPGVTGRFLQSNAAAAPSFSTATFPSVGGTAGNILISDGTNYIASTSLWPNTVGTSRKVVISNGTSNVYSTETYAVPGTSGNVMTSDGTNWTSAAAAGVTLLTTKGDLFGFSTVNARVPVGTTNGQVLQVNSANAVGVGYSTPTYPSASGTAGQILRSDGTNNLYTTSTYPDTNAINTLLYASAANVMSALATANNGVLVTSGTGVPSISSTLPAFTTSSITFSPTTGGIVGTTTNDNAAAGKVGEYISSVVLSGSAVSLVTGTAKTITSISLTAGDWDVWGELWLTGGGTTQITIIQAGINTVNNTQPTVPADGTSFTIDASGATTTAVGVIWTIGGTAAPNQPVNTCRISVSGTTTVYLIATVSFSVSTCSGFGKICARRVR